MSAKEVIRNYHFEDGVLSTEASRIKNDVKRDLDDFAKRGITPDTLTDFQTAIDAFNDYPTDEELAGPAITATEDKNKLVTSIHEQVASIRDMAERQYHETGKYKTFGFEGMDKMSDPSLYRLALRVVRVGNKLLSELAGKGLTQAILDDLKKTATNFDAALEAQSDAQEDRDLATQQRILLGNALYAILAELASVGKSLYQNTNEAKYNDYVLYQEESGTPPVPPTA